MLKAVNISKFYGAKKALDAITFDLASGETVGVLGIEGSGKSTLMKILAGCQTPTNGSVTLNGEDPRFARTRNAIGYLAQSSPLPPLMRVGEYLRFRAGLKGIYGKKNVEKAFDGVAGFCPIQPIKDTIIARLSRNDRQWVGIADALLGTPELLLFDDPAGGMDSSHAVRVWELIAELTGRGTFVIACKSLAEIARLCKRAVVLNRGRLAADGDPDAMFLEYVEERIVTLSIIANEPVREAFRAVPGVRTVIIGNKPERGDVTTVKIAIPAGVDLRRELSGLCTRRGWIITGMELEPITLDDVFRNMR